MNDALQFSRVIEVKRGDVSATGTLAGYGAVFGNVDRTGDLIAKGAFSVTLRDWRKKGKLPPMLLQHGGFFGSAEDGIPIGIWTDMSEDATGLLVKGELFAIDSDKGRYIHEGLKSGALDGLSIGYVASDVVFGKKPDDPRRTLKKIDLFEVSIVTFPANDASRVTGAKSIKSARDLEEALHRIGFSRREAKRVVAGGWSALARQESSELNQAAKLLRARAAAITKGA